jgi:hypothetical protein
MVYLGDVLPKQQPSARAEDTIDDISGGPLYEIHCLRMNEMVLDAQSIQQSASRVDIYTLLHTHPSNKEGT